MVRCVLCIGYRREKIRTRKKKKVVHLHSLEGNRESWKVVGSDLFLETLSVKRRWIRGEPWRQREAYPGGRGGWLDKGLGRKGGEEREDRWKEAGEGARLDWV